MYDTIEAVPSVPSRNVAESKKTGSSRLWQRLALGGVLLISIFMNFYQLGQNGFANLYYASAIRSMLDSWQAPSRYSSTKQFDGHHIARAGSLGLEHDDSKSYS